MLKQKIYYCLISIGALFLIRGVIGAENLAPDSFTGTQRTINLSGLNKKYRNAIVRIEFTMIMNLSETKLNPTKSEQYYGRGYEASHGTGFFISEDEILTNAHIVTRARHGSLRIKSPATGNVEFKVEIVGVGGTQMVDLAILRLPEDELLRFKKRSGLGKVPVLKLGDSDKVKQADLLAIFGYPEASDELKVIQAEVTGRHYQTLGFGRFLSPHQFIEVGPGGVVQHGNSGGPALDRNGIVVGIPSRGSYRGQQGWLIPSNIVKHYLDRIRENQVGNQSLRIPSLGVVLAENFPGISVWSGAPEDCTIFELGVIVREVEPGGLGAEWGLSPGDIIVAFANTNKQFQCALDFRGYRVVTGKMRNWPPAKSRSVPEGELPKIHLEEMIFLSDEGDQVTLGYIPHNVAKPLTSLNDLSIMTNQVRYKQPAGLSYLGTFQKADFELWGDFVAQDFDSYNTSYFNVPVREILKGGVLVTYVEAHSLARRRGLDPSSDMTKGYSLGEEGPVGSWVIIESVNGQEVKNLSQLRKMLRAAEKQFQEKQQSAGYDPAKKLLYKERYVQIGFRTITSDGNILHQTPAFPIDEALECRKGLNLDE